LKFPTTFAISASDSLNIQKKLKAKGKAILEMKVAENIKDGPSVNP